MCAGADLGCVTTSKIVCCASFGRAREETRTSDSVEAYGTLCVAYLIVLLTCARGDGLSDCEYKNLKERIGLKLRYGGLGVLLVRNTAKAAFVGTWSAIASDVFRNCRNEIIGNFKRSKGVDYNIEDFMELPTIRDIANEADSLCNTLDPDNFTDKQIKDIGLSSGKLSITKYLIILANDNAGLTHEGKVNQKYLQEMEHVRKMQSRLSHAVNLAAANKLHESIMGDGPSDPSKNAKLRAFSASRGVLAI